jgi:hypothetical protein
MDIRFNEVSHGEFYYPQHHPFYYIAHKAGDVVRTGLFRLSKKTYSENIYHYLNDWPSYEDLTKKNLMDKGFSEEQFTDDDILTKPGVKIHFLSGEYRYIEFDTYKEAENFYSKFNSMRCRLIKNDKDITLEIK